MTSADFPYTDYMTLEEWKLFVENYGKYNFKYLNHNIQIKEYMNGQHKSFFWFICYAFLWSSTKQGHNHWAAISNRKEPINQNYEL